MDLKKELNTLWKSTLLITNNNYLTNIILEPTIHQAL